MQSSRSSVIIALIIIAISIFLLIVYFRKQGEYTFGFIESLYNEMMGTQTSVSIRSSYQEDIQFGQEGCYLGRIWGK